MIYWFVGEGIQRSARVIQWEEQREISIGSQTYGGESLFLSLCEQNVKLYF